jgi:hypothetical protein
MLAVPLTDSMPKNLYHGFGVGKIDSSDSISLESALDGSNRFAQGGPLKPFDDHVLAARPRLGMWSAAPFGRVAYLTTMAVKGGTVA